MKKVIFLSVLFWMFLNVPLIFASTPESVPEVITKLKESNSQIRNLECLFIKDVVKDGIRMPETQLNFKYVKEPQMIYLEFMNRYKGQKCVYVKGENEDKMVVRPSGFMKFMKIKLDPKGKKAMAEDIDPVTSMGFDSIIDIVEESYNLSVKDASISSEYIENVSIGDGKFNLIKIYSNNSDDDYIHLYLSQKSFLPYKVSYKMQKNSATYTYENLVTNINLAGDDFQI